MGRVVNKIKRHNGYSTGDDVGGGDLVVPFRVVHTGDVNPGNG